MPNHPENHILVTGAYGFLGSSFVRRLAKRHPTVKVVAIGRNLHGDIFGSYDNVEEREGDLQEPSVWANLPNTLTHIIHLAVHIPWKGEKENPGAIISDNVIPLFHLLQKTIHLPRLKQIIYGSSIAVYEKQKGILVEDSQALPATYYGAAKLAGENILNPLRGFGINVCHLRFTSIYGLGQYPGTVLPLMMKRAQEGQELILFNQGVRKQNFIYREDAAMAICLAYEKQAAGIFNIGAAENISMRELATLIIQIFSPLVKISEKQKSDEDAFGFQVDISKALTELGFAPSSLFEGLRRYKEEKERSCDKAV